MPDSIVNSVDPDPQDEASPPPDHHGYFELFTRGAAKGWAFDRARPGRPGGGAKRVG